MLVENQRVPGGLSVKQFTESEKAAVTLPPTNPGMPMYMDSPGHAVVMQGNTLRVLVPAGRVNNKTQFNYDGVTAYMQVMPGAPDLPLLGVYEVYDVWSGDLSLPGTVQ